jgi:hypothetical protein
METFFQERRAALTRMVQLASKTYNNGHMHFEGDDPQGERETVVA